MSGEEREYEQPRDMPGQHRFDGSTSKSLIEKPLFDDTRLRGTPTVEQVTEETNPTRGSSLYTGVPEPSTPNLRLY